MIEFREQAVVVSGAGRGLGRLYALDLARRGASVVVNDVGSAMNGDGHDERVAPDPHSIPASISDEVFRVCTQLGIG
jgi:NAD(P)-dependent dehydrogenase (short-subunit alcohol dehydrogenase family)